MIVTVITPSYNQARFLEYSIQSVLAQRDPGRGEFQVEYFVVDGGSTDGSLDIIRKYEPELAWWVSEPDAGQADAINKGFQRAQGELVAWLNSDDLYLPGSVAEAVHVMQSNPHLGMVFGDAIAIDQNGEILNRWKFGDWGLRDLMRFRVICQPAVFIRKSVLEDAGFLDRSYHFMLDHKLWLQIAQIAPIQHVSSIWAAARSHPGAKNIASAQGFSQETLRLLEWMKTHPRLSSEVENHRREIEGGVYRLSARYLLDGGFPRLALQNYGLALWYSPSFAIKHWHRMVYAILLLLGVQRLVDWFFTFQRRRRKSRLNLQGLTDWPGLSALH